MGNEGELPSKKARRQSESTVLEFIVKMAADRCVLTLLVIYTVMIQSTISASGIESTNDVTLANFLPKEHVCPGKFDVVVMQDRSREVPREVFTKYIEFIKNKLLHLFAVEEGGSHFGLVLYNDNPQIAMKLNETNNATFVKNYLMTSLPGRQGGRNLQRALRFTRKELLTEVMGDRPDSPNICLLFTTEDGARVKGNKQFPKINEVCDRFVRWRFADYNNPHKVKKRLCPPLSAEEAKNRTIDVCKGLFTCTSTYYNDLKQTCEGDSLWCPLPYVLVGERCFHTTLTQLTLDEASEQCQLKNGYLLQLNSAEKNAAFEEYISPLMIDAEQAVWIGLRDVTGNNADWEWIVDGTNLTYSNWSGFGNQPNSNSQRCVLFLLLTNLYGQWEDTNCDRQFRGVCETDPIIH